MYTLFVLQELKVTTCPLTDAELKKFDIDHGSASASWDDSGRKDKSSNFVPTWMRDNKPIYEYLVNDQSIYSVCVHSGRMLFGMGWEWLKKSGGVVFKKFAL